MRKSKSKNNQGNSRKTIKKGGSPNDDDIYVYCVLENNELYPNLYYSYQDAYDAVEKKNYAEMIENEIDEEDMRIENNDGPNPIDGETNLFCEFNRTFITIKRFKLSKSIILLSPASAA